MGVKLIMEQKMRVKITADSTCDLSPELVEKYNISISPLSGVIDGQVHKDGLDVRPEDVFRAVDQGKKVQTAAVNQFEYEEFFRPLLAEYDAIVHFCISKEMSSCFADACKVAEKLGNIYVIDSRTLSTGIGLLALEACEMAAMGRSAREIYDQVMALRDKVVTTFVVRDIGYLYRGGRCSGLEALGAKMLRIRPEIVVHEGRMSPGEKYRGSYEHYLKHYIKDVLKRVENVDYKRAFITHSPCEDGMTEFAAQCLREYGHFREVLDTVAGCTVCTHCGPNTLGVLFMRK